VITILLPAFTTIGFGARKPRGFEEAEEPEPLASEEEGCCAEFCALGLLAVDEFAPLSVVAFPAGDEPESVEFVLFLHPTRQRAQTIRTHWIMVLDFILSPRKLTWAMKKS
jgi:hypothetical protein